MPTYEYRCANAHAFEQFQKMSDPPLAACPQCGAPAERILSGGAGLLFKGSGFYITDYRSDSYKKAAESDQAPTAGGAGTSPGQGSEKAPGQGGGKNADESGGKSSGKSGGKSGGKSSDESGGGSSDKSRGGSMDAPSGGSTAG